MMNKEDQNLQKSPAQAPSPVFSWVMFGQAGFEFAFLIAAPLIIFIYLGAIFRLVGLDAAADWADYNRHNSFTYKLVGLLIAIFFSFYMIFKKIMAVKKLIYPEKKD